MLRGGNDRTPNDPRQITFRLHPEIDLRRIYNR